MKRLIKKDAFPKLMGILLLLFCIVICTWRIWESKKQGHLIATYQKEVMTLNDEQYLALKKEAVKYNDVLFQSEGLYIPGLSDTYLSDEAYEKTLTVGSSKVMARISIPKINVALPVYHGTSDEVLANGIGHLQSSSLPIGGENTRAILSGHRGMVEADMFTRLDELEEGDLIFIEVLNEKLAYQVTDRQVILPEQTEYLSIEDGEDMLTLVTCTPIYTNTHRLIVNAKRIDYTEDIDKATFDFNLPSGTYMLFYGLIPLTALGLLIYFIYDGIQLRKKDNQERTKQNEKEKNKWSSKRT